VHASAPLSVDLLVMLTRFMLRGSGEGSFHISSTVQQVGEAYGVSAEVQAFPDSAVLLVRTDEGEWSAVIHEVADIPRLDRAAELRELVHEVDGGRLPVGQALQRLERLGSSSALYPAWTVLPGLALFALGFGLSVQATWQEVILSPLLGALVGAFVLLRRAEPKLAPAAPLLAASTVSALVLALYPVVPLKGAPVELMIPALFYFIPGDVLSAAILEVSVGRISAGVTRLGYALVQLFALSIGVVVGGIVTRTQPDALFQTSVAPDFSGWVVAVGWLVFAIGMVWSFSLRWRDFGWMVLLIYLGFAVVEVGTALFGELAGTLLAGIAASFVVSLLTRAPTRPPYLVMILGAFFVLTVGAKGLRGLTALGTGDLVQGFTSWFDMAEVGTALSLGMLLGNVLASLVPDRRHQPGRQ
jgi:uncharacterized membrane protein YjjP (DUF1212 family)